MNNAKMVLVPGVIGLMVAMLWRFALRPVSTLPGFQGILSKDQVIIVGTLRRDEIVLGSTYAMLRGISSVVFEQGASTAKKRFRKPRKAGLVKPKPRFLGATPPLNEFPDIT